MHGKLAVADVVELLHNEGVGEEDRVEEKAPAEREEKQKREAAEPIA